MTKEMKDLIDKYWDEDKHERIVELIMAVPEGERDVDMLGQLVVAYNNLGRYDDAIALSMELKGKSDEPSWHYRIAYAYIRKKEWQKGMEHAEAGLAAAEKEDNALIAKRCRNLCSECLPHLPEGRENMKFENEPIELVWSDEDGEYKVAKGVVNMGYIGTFLPSQISVNFDDADMEWLFSHEDDDHNGYAVKAYITRDMSHEELAKGLSDFFNARVQELAEHIVEINQAFLANLLLEMCDCDFPFWEDCPSLTIADKLPKTENIVEAVYTGEVRSKIYELYDRYDEKPLNGAVDNTPWAEELMEAYLPMFDYRKMLGCVYAEYLSLEYNSFSFQCSCAGEALHIVCGAYAELLNDITLFDWHNH